MDHAAFTNYHELYENYDELNECHVITVNYVFNWKYGSLKLNRVVQI
jgi:hypothetical protein